MIAKRLTDVYELFGGRMRRKSNCISRRRMMAASQSRRSLPVLMFRQSLEPLQRLAHIDDGAVTRVDLEQIDPMRKLRAIEAALLDGEDRKTVGQRVDRRRAHAARRRCAGEQD